MSRLLRLMLLLTFISTLLILATRLIGSVRPAMTLASVMSKLDGTRCDHPCLFGIRPGETSVEQAVQILNSHPLTRASKWLDDHTLQLTGPAAYVAFSLTPDKMIDSITFTDNLDDPGIPVPGSLADSIQLGELISTLSIPNVLLPGSNYFVLGFPAVGIIAATVRPLNVNTFMRPDTPLNLIMIYSVRPCPNENLITTFKVQPWIGFTTLKRYQNDHRLYNFSHRASGVPVPPYAQCQQ